MSVVEMDLIQKDFNCQLTIEDACRAHSHSVVLSHIVCKMIITLIFARTTTSAASVTHALSSSRDNNMYLYLPQSITRCKRRDTHFSILHEKSCFVRNTHVFQFNILHLRSLLPSMASRYKARNGPVAAKEPCLQSYCTVTMLTGCTEASKYIIDRDALCSAALSS